jgi:hypothetical protein
MLSGSLAVAGFRAIHRPRRAFDKRLDLGYFAVQSVDL